jgi:CubicO group peptidase (beta-lactamase class C family)
MRKSGLLLLVVAVAAIPLQLVAQVTPSPASIDRIFAAFDKPGSPGCAVGVSKDGELIYERGYGYANLEWGIP